MEQEVEAERAGATGWLEQTFIAVEQEAPDAFTPFFNVCQMEGA